MSPARDTGVPVQRRSPENDSSRDGEDPRSLAAVGAGPSASLPDAEPFGKAFPGRQAISLKSIADLADSLPYLLGYVPGNSVVLLALHGEWGRLGRRTALRIPADPTRWPQAAERVATMLLGSPGRGRGSGATALLRRRCDESLPDGVIAFLFQEPHEARPGTVPQPGAAEVREGLRPLAQHIRVACGSLDVPVVEALCVSTGRSWSYVTPLADQEQSGVALLPVGSSVLAATSVYEGTPAPLPAARLESRLLPWSTAAAREQERVLDRIALDLLPQILGGRENVLKIRRGTIGLLDNVLTRFATVPVPSDRLKADLADDAALTHEEAARLVIGLQDREARDEAASFLAFPDAALRLWRALARRCVLSYKEHAAAPLSLAGWTAWSQGEESEARLSLHLALAVDPHYVFAALLDQAFDKGVEPEEIRQRLCGSPRRPTAHRSSARPASARTGSAADGAGRGATSEQEAGVSRSAAGASEGAPEGEVAEPGTGDGRRRVRSASRTGSASRSAASRSGVSARTGPTARPSTRRRDTRRPGGPAQARPSSGKTNGTGDDAGRTAYARARRRVAASPPGRESTRANEREADRERHEGENELIDVRGRRAASDRFPLAGLPHPESDASDAVIPVRAAVRPVTHRTDRAAPSNMGDSHVGDSPVARSGSSPVLPVRESSAQNVEVREGQGTVPSVGQEGSVVLATGARPGSQEACRRAQRQGSGTDSRTGSANAGQEQLPAGPEAGNGGGLVETPASVQEAEARCSRRGGGSEPAGGAG